MSLENVFLFADEAAARADATVGAFWIPASSESVGAWNSSVCIPGVRAWDSRQDTISESGDVSHAYWPGWRICIGTDELRDDFLHHPHIVLISDNVKRELERRPIGEWLIYKPEGIAIEDVPFIVISP